MRFFTFAAPSRFYALSGVLIPWFWLATVCLTVLGLYLGFFVAPTDAQQGEAYRIIFVHVPTAWMSMGKAGLPGWLIMSTRPLLMALIMAWVWVA